MPDEPFRPAAPVAEAGRPNCVNRTRCWRPLCNCSRPGAPAAEAGDELRDLTSRVVGEWMRTGNLDSAAAPLRRLVAERDRWRHATEVLNERLTRVEALHRPVDRGTGPQCEGCATHVTFTRWPCKTIRAIDRKAAPEEETA